MKLLHTSDWHIGRTLNEKSLIQDQAFVLEHIKHIITREKPDVVMIAGDLYDRSVPSKEALALVDNFLTWTVLEQRIPVFVIGGNHDGRERLDFSGGILRKQGLYMTGQYQNTLTPIVLEDSFGSVAFWSVPFIRPVEYRSLGNDAGEDYDTMYAAICKKITQQMDCSQRNVLITHGLILNGADELEMIDDSVRPVEIGGVSFAKSSYFDAFDYVALGHLHRPQKVGKETVRYAGSLLKYSFSECKQKKSVTLIELGEKGSCTIRQEALPALHDMREIRGTLSALTDVAAYDVPGREDYLRVVLEDDIRQINPMDKLRKVYPNVLEMSYAKNLAAGGKQRRVKERISSPRELFSDFYADVHGEAPSDTMMAAVDTLLKEVAQNAADDA